MRARSVALALLATLAIAACDRGVLTRTDPPGDAPPDRMDDPPADPPTDPPVVSGDPQLCVGIRGNGPRLTAHFGALARIIEHYGLIDATAGGSSATITSFILESIQLNPLVGSCETCTEEERATRAATLLKSIQGYLEAVSGNSEAQVIRFVRGLDAEMEHRGVDYLLENFRLNSLASMRSVLEETESRALVNDEVLRLMEESPDKIMHARDVLEGLRTALDFRANTTSFVRPGMLSVPALAERLGRLADFYAGYEPTDLARMEAFLDRCGDAGRGMTWSDLARIEAGEATCGEMFNELVIDYRAARPSVSPRPRRIDEPVGEHLRGYYATALIVDESVSAFDDALKAYWDGNIPTELGVDFGDIRVGYFGGASDLARLESNPLGYSDLKTQRTMSLGNATWLEVLSLSPAEPGLSRGQTLDGVGVAVGGWADPHPVPVLRTMGCERVIYLTRRGGDGQFVTDVTRELGITEGDARSLTALDGESSFRLALEEADGVWCTDWDAPDPTDLDAMQRVGYEAPFETTAPGFTGSGRYENLTDATNLPGCTPGVTEEPGR